MARQFSLWFDDKTYLSARQSDSVGHDDAPFVIIRLGEKREGYTAGGLPRGLRKTVLARGRIENGRVRVTRGSVSVGQVRSWLRSTGYQMTVVGAKRR